MLFFQNLYLGEKIAPKAEEVMKKLNNDKLIPELYLITMSKNLDNMLEIVSQWEVLQKGYPSTDIKVVGLANGKKEAITVVQLIVEQALQETGSANAREYLMEKWEEQV